MNLENMMLSEMSRTQRYDSTYVGFRDSPSAQTESGLAPVRGPGAEELGVTLKGYRASVGGDGTLQVDPVNKLLKTLTYTVQSCELYAPYVNYISIKLSKINLGIKAINILLQYLRVKINEENLG